MEKEKNEIVKENEELKNWKVVYEAGLIIIIIIIIIIILILILKKKTNIKVKL